VVVIADQEAKSMPKQKSKTKPTQTLAETAGEFLIGNELRVARLGYGAMRITGDGVWGAG
jgi:hypothetical protein